MKNASLLREFAKYVSLNVMGMIGLSCYILADTFFVARGLGANGLTALNLAIPIYSFIHGSGLMFGMGGATRYAILKSQGEAEKANRVFTNSLIAAMSVAAVFFAVGLFLSDPITRLLGADAAVFAMSRTYLRVILLFAPMFMLNNLLLCFVRNDGAPQLSMFAMIGGSLSNVVLDYVFIFPFKMGIFGAVLATGLAPIFSILILSPFFLKKRNRFKPVGCALVPRLIAGVVSSGVPSLITEVSSGIVMIVFNTIILGLQGNVGVAAYGIVANLSLVVIAIYTGMAQGIQPIVSSSYGAGRHADVKTILRYAMTTMAVVSALIYASVFFGASKIVSAFNSEQNVLLLEIATAGLRIYFTACVFAGFNIIMSVYFTSTENATPAHIISVLRGFALIVPLAFLLSAIGGLTGVWSAFPMTELLVGCIGFGLFRMSERKNAVSSSEAVRMKMRTT